MLQRWSMSLSAALNGQRDGYSALPFINNGQGEQKSRSEVFDSFGCDRHRFTTEHAAAIVTEVLK